MRERGPRTLTTTIFPSVSFFPAPAALSCTSSFSDHSLDSLSSSLSSFSLQAHMNGPMIRGATEQLKTRTKCVFFLLPPDRFVGEFYTHQRLSSNDGPHNRTQSPSLKDHDRSGERANERESFSRNFASLRSGFRPNISGKGSLTHRISV